MFSMSEFELDTKERSVRKKYDWSDKIILIAEDEEINYYYLKESLEETKATVIRAVNGFEAFQRIKNKEVTDIILMDMKMPIMDGYEATSKIKALNNSIPVIAQTAYALSGEKRKSKESGCDDFLSKPINPAELIDTIAKYLEE